MKILIVDSNPGLAEKMRTQLISNQYEVNVVCNSNEGIDCAMTDIYDLMIIGVITDTQDRCTVVKNLRNLHNGIRILMLTEKSDVRDRIRSLDAGADFCLEVPFDDREFMSFIHAILRRYDDEIGEISLGNTVLNTKKCMLSCKGICIRLSEKEYRLMLLLMQYGGNNLKKDFILLRVWGYDTNAVENNVEVYIGFLRKKLRNLGSNIKIATIRRMGYHLEIEN